MNYSKPLKATQSHSKPLKATQSHSKPLKATQSHSKPLKATQSHSKPLKATQSPLTQQRKSGVFLVISLMLVAGLFVNEAAPQGHIYSDLISFRIRSDGSPPIPIDAIQPGRTYDLSVFYTSHNDDKKQGFRLDIPEGIQVIPGSISVRMRAFHTTYSATGGVGAPDRASSVSDYQYYEKPYYLALYALARPAAPYPPPPARPSYVEYDGVVYGTPSFPGNTNPYNYTMTLTQGEDGSAGDKGLYVNGNRITIRQSAEDLENVVLPARRRSPDHKLDAPVVRLHYLVYCQIRFPSVDATYKFDYQVNRGTPTADDWDDLQVGSIDLTTNGVLRDRFRTAGFGASGNVHTDPIEQPPGLTYPYPVQYYKIFDPQDRAPVYGTHGWRGQLRDFPTNYETPDQNITRKRQRNTPSDASFYVTVRAGLSGRVNVGWGHRANADMSTTTPATIATDSATAPIAPLAAGSIRNVLKFSYLPRIENMAGGRFRIAIPSGWKVSNKFLSVEDDDETVIYATDKDGTVTTNLTDSSDSVTKVEFTADQRITVTLGSDWAQRDVDKELIVRLGDVTAAIPRSLPDTDKRATTDTDDDVKYFGYQFQCSESPRDRVLSLLSAQPVVRVGNIIGDKDDTRDPLERKVVIKPGRVFPGESKISFDITFTAPGPMYGRDLIIYIPDTLQPDDDGIALTDVGKTSSSQVYVRQRGGAPGDIGDPTVDEPDEIHGLTGNDGDTITIPMTKMNIGQQVIVSYTRDTAIASNAFSVSVDPDDINQSAFLAVTAVTGSTGEDKAVEKIEGGVIINDAGSGKVDLSPVSVEAGSQRRDITVTYTAYTDLTNTTIEITPAGLVIDASADQILQDDDSAAYGYVTGSESDSLTVATSEDTGTLTWTSISIKKGKTVTARIRRVNIVADAGEYPWAVTVGGQTDAIQDDPTTTDVNEIPILSVVKTSADAITFAIDGADTFSAGSEATINFKFTAESTPIRGGLVRLTIPSTLGSAPTKSKKTAGRVAVSGNAKTSGGVAAIGNDQITVSGRTVSVAIGQLNVGDSVIITYGSTADDGKAAVLHHVAADVEVTGSFRTASGGSTRTAGTVTVTLGNIIDGKGVAVLSPASIEAGSSNRALEVTFTAAGTMDGGAVSLELPSGWGSMQNDPQKRNYITTRGSGVSSLEIGSNLVIATIDKLAKGGSFRFVYGGGTGADVGAEVQDVVGTADFKIKSDGDGDGVFALITSELEHKDREKIRNPDKTGKIYKDKPGILQIKVTGALDGTGTVAVDTETVRAAADDVRLEFTYTPSQTIEDGALKITVPSSWSKPQVEEVGEPGYTEVEGVGLGSAADDDKFSVTVPIFSLDKTNTIRITYGATGTGRAVASATTGTDAFRVAVRGHQGGNLAPLRTQPTITVNPQASGKGKAVLAVTDGDAALHTGDTDRELTVTYTAAGQMIGGKVRLTIPAGWSAPSAETVTVTPAFSPTFDGQMIIVEGVNLSANGTVTFVYTGDVQPAAGTGVKFAVAVHGGDAADSFVDVSGDATMLTVDIGEARPGSGSGTVTPRIVQAGATGVDLTFTYTAVGIIDAPREFRVQVPAPWTAPNNAATSEEDKGTYTVVHRHKGAATTVSVEKLDPVGRDMVARVKLGGLEVEAGDEIIFTYENADAPTAREVTPFKILFDGRPIVADVQVRVQGSTPSQLSLSSAGAVSADAGAMPLAITVGLRDADGNETAMGTDVDVTLTSSSAGTFAETAEATGTEAITVTIPTGDVAAMVYYHDSTVGAATVTASAPNLTPAAHEVTVTTDMITLLTASIDTTMAKTGDTVMVNATGTANQMLTFSIGSIVTEASMTESPEGTYTGSYTAVADLHDGVHEVTVTLTETGSSLSAGMLTVDTMAPAVTVAASPDTVSNGEMVVISATVTDAGAIASVMADVSMLDSTQTTVALTMADDASDGAYSAEVTISADNEAMNGMQTITVTAIDAAGNSGMASAMVMLQNSLEYTSMIPAGVSLFHVPLRVEGLDTVGDLLEMIGETTATLAITYDGNSWNSRSGALPITADLGIVLSMTADTTVTFTGEAWDDGTINLNAGQNLVGLPLNDASVTNISDIITLFDGSVANIIVSIDGNFQAISQAGDPGDGPVMGDAAYLITATADASATLTGDGWTNDTMAGAAPIALAGYKIDGQTPVLDVRGAVVDEITGLAREGFRVKVKNLSTKSSLSRITSDETAAIGYNMTFVDLNDAHAARVGDVIEISVDSPDPLIGVKPVRHIVTTDDVKSGILEVEDLIAYEIPAETELLRNYPNPFNPETWIPYRLAEDADVTLTLYDSTGRVVRTLDLGHQTAAVYESRSKAIYWDGRNRFGEQVASGIYFYSLSAGDFSATRKMLILK